MNEMPLRSIYKALAEQYLREQYSIERLEDRFAQSGLPFHPQKEHLFVLVNEPHLERLKDQEKAILEQIAREKTDAGTCAEFVINTCDKVMAGDLRNGVNYEFFPDVHERGLLPGNSIVFYMDDCIKMDEKGGRNWEVEERKEKLFQNVKSQFEQIANEKCERKVYLLRI